LNGQTIRVHVNTISIQGRNASGVCVVKLRTAKERIVAMAVTEYAKDEDEEDSEISENGDESDVSRETQQEVSDAAEVEMNSEE
jgi:DNA gyrase subunit A